MAAKRAKAKTSKKKATTRKSTTRKSTIQGKQGGSPFGPGLLRFLRDLEANNNRAFFEANKDRYEEQVREPARALIRALAPQIERLSPHLVASDKKVGGSLMRIFRDVRFSKDKSPYKTNLGIQFRHEDGKDVHAPGLYLHIDPKDVFLGAGMWHPDSDALRGVRASIDENGAAWKRVRDNKSFRSVWNFEGDSLKRAPRGYDEDHPLIEDLRRKDHIAVVRLKKGDITKPDFPKLVMDHLKKAKGLMAWQAKALGLPF
ncbi:MAG: DUF2461 domain-containing protein [bacterium]|nr:DUF2461 domain-containing protein [bacterium]